MTATIGARRHRVIGQGNHSTVYHRRGSSVVLQVFTPDAPELTVEKVQREYRYLRTVFDPALPGLIPDQQLRLPHSDALLADAIMVKDYVPVAAGWSLRTVRRDQLPRQALHQLEVFIDLVRELLADPAPRPTLDAQASLIPDFIDPPLENLAVDTAGQLRLLDTNRLISTRKLREQHQAGELLTLDRDDVAAKIFRLMFRRLMFLSHRFLGVAADALRADPLFTRYLHPTQIETLIRAGDTVGEPIEP